MLHVLFDSPLYWDIKPFYPLTVNPLYGSGSSLEIYLLSVWMGSLGIIFYLLLLTVWAYKRLQKRPSKTQGNNTKIIPGAIFLFFCFSPNFHCKACECPMPTSILSCMLAELQSLPRQRFIRRKKVFEPLGSEPRSPTKALFRQNKSNARLFSQKKQCFHL